MRYRVACSGSMDDEALGKLRARGIRVEFSGPDTPHQRYYLTIDADHAISARREADTAIEAAGALCTVGEVREIDA